MSPFEQLYATVSLTAHAVNLGMLDVHVKPCRNVDGELWLLLAEYSVGEERRLVAVADVELGRSVLTRAAELSDSKQIRRDGFVMLPGPPVP